MLTISVDTVDVSETEGAVAVMVSEDTTAGGVTVVVVVLGTY